MFGLDAVAGLDQAVYLGRRACHIKGCHHQLLLHVLRDPGIDTALEQYGIGHDIHLVTVHMNGFDAVNKKRCQRQRDQGGNAVALDVLGVAGAHDLAHTAVAVAEDGLAQVFLGDVNILAALHVTDAAAIHRATHGVADLFFVPPEKTLPVADRFVLAR